MFKDPAMRVFIAHLVAFVVITAGLAALNLWFAPQYPWFLWVLMGWGALVATHALALLLRKTRRRERIFIDRKARSFTVHFFAYLATVLILLLVNITVTPKAWWFYWVALGWGAGILAHGWCAFGKKRPRAPTLQESRAAEPAKPEASAGKGRSPAPKRAPRKPRPGSPKR
jgi:hypothetical protein